MKKTGKQRDKGKRLATKAEAAGNRYGIKVITCRYMVQSDRLHG